MGPETAQRVLIVQITLTGKTEDLAQEISGLVQGGWFTEAGWRDYIEDLLLDRLNSGKWTTDITVVRL